MKLRGQITLIIVAVLLLTLAIALLRPKPEPQYHGRSLSDWLTQLITNYPRMDREAVHALNAMGENAVRALANTVEDDDSLLTIKLLEYSDKLPMLADILPSKFWGRFVAVKALSEMGTNAASAVPSLEKLADDDDNTLAPTARAALVLIQNQPIEALAAEYFDFQSTNSLRAYGILLALGPKGKPAIPRVLNELQSTNERVRLGAASLLRNIGIESLECIPVFTNLLSDTNFLIRVFAIDGLANCDNMAKSAVPAVVQLLEDPESLCRTSALMYLWRVIPPESFEPYRPAVQKATTDTDQSVRVWAQKVLQEKKE